MTSKKTEPAEKKLTFHAAISMFARLRTELLVVGRRFRANTHSKMMKNDGETDFDLAELISSMMTATSIQITALHELTYRLTREAETRRVQKIRDDRAAAQVNVLKKKVEILDEALQKAHDAMMTWFSSEYANHPLSREVKEARALANKTSDL